MFVGAIYLKGCEVEPTKYLHMYVHIHSFISQYIDEIKTQIDFTTSKLQSLLRGHICML